MDIPETITQVFTKYDTIIERIKVPWLIPDIVATEFSMVNCWQDIAYSLSRTEEGLEGVVFAHYDRVHAGGFIGGTEGKITITDCKATGEINIAGRTNGKSLAS